MFLEVSKRSGTLKGKRKDTIISLCEKSAMRLLTDEEKKMTIDKLIDTFDPKPEMVQEIMFEFGEDVIEYAENLIE